jgi:hypothetical protein
MSNTFKSDNRFSGLVDTHDYDNKSIKMMKKMGWKEGDGLGKKSDGIKTPVVVEKTATNTGIGFKHNTFKDDRPNHNRYRNKYLSDNELKLLRQEYKMIDDAKKQIEEIKKQESLQLNNFPKLVVDANDNTFNNITTNYIEKLNTNNQEVIVKNNLDKIDDDYIIIQKDILTGKTIFKNNMSNPPTISEQLLANNTVVALSDIHERRTNDLIELHDYDTWAKLFKFKDWREWDSKYESDSDEDTDDNDYTDDDDYNNVGFDYN